MRKMMKRKMMKRKMIKRMMNKLTPAKMVGKMRLKIEILKNIGILFSWQFFN